MIKCEMGNLLCHNRHELILTVHCRYHAGSYDHGTIGANPDIRGKICDNAKAHYSGTSVIRTHRIDPSENAVESCLKVTVDIKPASLLHRAKILTHLCFHGVAKV